MWRKIISSETFKDRLVLVAIDEVHCITERLVRMCNLHVVNLYCLILVGARIS